VTQGGRVIYINLYSPDRQQTDSTIQTIRETKTTKKLWACEKKSFEMAFEAI